MLHFWVYLKCGFDSFSPLLAMLEAFPKMKASSFLSFEVWSRTEQREREKKKKISLMGDGFLEKHAIESTGSVLKPASPWSISIGSSPPIPGRLLQQHPELGTSGEQWQGGFRGVQGVEGVFRGVQGVQGCAHPGQGRLLIVESVIQSCDSQPHPMGVEGSQVWPSAVSVLRCEKLFLDVFRLQPSGFLLLFFFYFLFFFLCL